MSDDEVFDEAYEMLSSIDPHRTRFHVLTELGAGAFGECYLLFDKSDNLFKVLKVFNNPRDSSKANNEFARLQKLSIPLTLKSYEYLEDENSFIMDFLPGVTIQNFIQTLIDYGLSLNPLSILKVFFGLIISTKEMHKNNLLHRDIKSENVMLDTNFFPHIIDWGESRETSSSRATITQVTHGTFAFIPKEAILYHESSSKTDIYGIGTVIAQLITKDWLYSDLYCNIESVNKYLVLFKASSHQLPKNTSIENVYKWFENLYKEHKALNEASENETEKIENDILTISDHIVRVLILNDIVYDIFGEYHNSVYYNPKLQPIIDLCNRCLQIDPNDRPSAEEIYNELQTIAMNTGLLTDDEKTELLQSIHEMENNSSSLPNGTIDNVQNCIRNGFQIFESFANWPNSECLSTVIDEGCFPSDPFNSYMNTFLSDKIENESPN